MARRTSDFDPSLYSNINGKRSKKCTYVLFDNANSKSIKSLRYEQSERGGFVKKQKTCTEQGRSASKIIAERKRQIFCNIAPEPSPSPPFRQKINREEERGTWSKNMTTFRKFEFD